MTRSPAKLLFLIAAMTLVAAFSFAQTKRRPVVKKPDIAVPTATPQPAPEPTPDPARKRNERPGGKVNTDNTTVPVSTKTRIPTHFYEFTRPGFLVEKIFLEHNDSGKGTISFQKQGSDEMITDPIEVSKGTLDKIAATLTALNFFDSTENYQYEKDYPHLGNHTFRFKIGEHERTVKFNWTTNKDAKLLMEEYRNIASFYVWKFDITIARENQPLQTPGLMDALDGSLRRGEISDPPQIVPFLTELSSDERMPLIARNRALKLIKEIAKEKK